MAEKTQTTIQKLRQELQELKKKLTQVRLDIKAGVETNTNAYKPLKKQIAQTLTKIRQLQLKDLKD